MTPAASVPSWLDRPANGRRVSYVMATRNKLAYLEATLPRLLRAKRPAEEELVVVDGASGDGTREYLQTLADRGDVDWLLSEPDHCEAHALNKALLAARGRYVTLVSDDDVFDFEVLHQMHAYMDDHPEVSVAYPSGADTRWDREPFVSVPPDNDVLARRAVIEDRSRAFPFSGLGLTFRRAALPEIGLFDLNLQRVDLAFSYRLTASPVVLAACSAFGYVRILNEQSLTVAMKARNFEEKERISGFYLGGGQTSGRRLLADALRRAVRRLTGALSPGDRDAEAVAVAASAPATPAERVRVAEAWLQRSNAGRPLQFIRRG